MKNKLLIMLNLLFFTITSNAQTLQDYLAIAKENSSELKINNYNYELAKEKVLEVGNNTNTSFNFGYYIQSPETRVGPQVAMGGIRQQLPWFGTKNAEREAAKSSADIWQYDIELSERELFYKVKEAYFNLYEKHSITIILEENKQILKTYEKMALAALENNKASFSDVSLIRVQKNEIDNKIFKNINEIIALSKNFNRLLQQDVNKEVIINRDVVLSELLIENKSIDNHPSLHKMDQLNEALDYENEQIGKENTPIIGLGLDYIFVSEIEDVDIVDNGKDIILPTISLSIPIFNTDYKSKHNQIKIRKDLIVSEKINQKRLLEMALEDAILNFKNSVIQIEMAQKNKVEVQRAISINYKAYETGILDYDNIVGLQLQKILYQLIEIEATKSALIAKASIEYLIN